MGDKAGIFPTDEGMDIPGLRDGDIVGTTLAAPPVAGLKREKFYVGLHSKLCYQSSNNTQSKKNDKIRHTMHCMQST